MFNDQNYYSSFIVFVLENLVYLPHAEHIRVRDGVAIFKSETPVLGQVAVSNVEQLLLSLLLGEKVQERHVLSVDFLVNQDCVSKERFEDKYIYK